MSGTEKLKKLAAKFHLDKAAQLKKAWEAKKSAGEKRIWKMQEELDGELKRLETEIGHHEEQAKVMT